MILHVYLHVHVDQSIIILIKKFRKNWRKSEVLTKLGKRTQFKLRKTKTHKLRINSRKMRCKHKSSKLCNKTILDMDQFQTDLRVWMVGLKGVLQIQILEQFVLSDPDFDPKEALKQERELEKLEKMEDKRTLKGAAKAVALAHKLSPKAQRKKTQIDPNIARLTVIKRLTIL